MAQVSNWDIQQDFFKINPEYLVIPLFKEVKTKYKKEYSDIMWFVALVNDPDSRFKNWSKQNKIEELKGMLPKDFLTKQRDYLDELGKKYLSLCETHPMRMLRIWKEKLDEKMEFMSENKYTVDYYEEVLSDNGRVRNVLRKGTWEMLEALQAGNVKSYKEYEQILKEMSKDEGANMGGSQDSLSDSGVI